MRTQTEIDRQIEGLKNMKLNLPMYNLFGDNNYEPIDAQIAILRGDEFEKDEDEDNSAIECAEYDAEQWLNGSTNEDLFED